MRPQRVFAISVAKRWPWMRIINVLLAIIGLTLYGLQPGHFLKRNYRDQDGRTVLYAPAWVEREIEQLYRSRDFLDQSIGLASASSVGQSFDFVDMIDDTTIAQIGLAMLYYQSTCQRIEQWVVEQRPSMDTGVAQISLRGDEQQRRIIRWRTMTEFDDIAVLREFPIQE